MEGLGIMASWSVSTRAQGTWSNAWHRATSKEVVGWDHVSSEPKHVGIYRSCRALVTFHLGLSSCSNGISTIELHRSSTPATEKPTEWRAGAFAARFILSRPDGQRGRRRAPGIPG